MLGRLATAVLEISTTEFLYSFLRSLVPNVLYEPPRRFKIGSPDKFPEGATYLEDSRVFVLRIILPLMLASRILRRQDIYAVQFRKSHLIPDHCRADRMMIC